MSKRKHESSENENYRISELEQELVLITKSLKTNDQNIKGFIDLVNKGFFEIYIQEWKKSIVDSRFSTSYSLTINCINLLNTITNNNLLETYVSQFVNNLLSEPKIIYKSLFSEKDFLICAILQLLIEISNLFKGKYISDVNFALDFSSKVFPKLLIPRRNNSNSKSNSTPQKKQQLISSRIKMINLLIVFFSYGSLSIKINLMKQSKVITQLFKYIIIDSPKDIYNLLNTIQISIINEKHIPTPVLSKFLNEWVITKIIQLYNRSDKHNIADLEITVANIAHAFLINISTIPNRGVCFPSNGWYPPSNKDGTNNNLVVHNRILLEVLKQMKPWNNEKELDLLVKICEANPELVLPFMKSPDAQKNLAFEPKLTSYWISLVALMSRIIQCPVPNNIINNKQDKLYDFPPETAQIIEALLPSPISLNNLTKGLTSETLLIRFFTSQIIILSLKKLLNTINLIEKRNDWDITVRNKSIADLKEEVLKRIPDSNSIINLFNASVNSEKPTYSLLLSDEALRIIILYTNLFPRNISFAGKLDFSSTISQYVDSIDDVIKNKLDSLRLKNVLELQFNLLGSTKWWNKSGKSNYSLFTYLLKLIYFFSYDKNNFNNQYLHNSILLDKIYAILGELVNSSFLFSTNLLINPIDWITSSIFSSMDDKLSKVDDSVWELINETVYRIMNSPYKYLDESMNILKECSNSNHKLRMKPLSSFLVAVVEQYSHNNSPTIAVNKFITGIIIDGWAIGEQLDCCSNLVGKLLQYSPTTQMFSDLKSVFNYIKTIKESSKDNDLNLLKKEGDQAYEQFSKFFENSDRNILNQIMSANYNTLNANLNIQPSKMQICYFVRRIEIVSVSCTSEEIKIENLFITLMKKSPTIMKTELFPQSLFWESLFLNFNNGDFNNVIYNFSLFLVNELKNIKCLDEEYEPIAELLEAKSKQKELVSNKRLFNILADGFNILTAKHLFLICENSDSLCAFSESIVNVIIEALLNKLPSDEINIDVSVLFKNLLQLSNKFPYSTVSIYNKLILYSNSTIDLDNYAKNLEKFYFSSNQENLVFAGLSFLKNALSCDCHIGYETYNLVAKHWDKFLKRYPNDLLEISTSIFTNKNLFSVNDTESQYNSHHIKLFSNSTYCLFIEKYLLQANNLSIPSTISTIEEIKIINGIKNCSTFIEKENLISFITLIVNLSVGSLSLSGRLSILQFLLLNNPYFPKEKFSSSKVELLKTCFISFTRLLSEQDVLSEEIHKDVWNMIDIFLHSIDDLEFQGFVNTIDLFLEIIFKKWLNVSELVDCAYKILTTYSSDRYPYAKYFQIVINNPKNPLLFETMEYHYSNIYFHIASICHLTYFKEPKSLGHMNSLNKIMLCYSGTSLPHDMLLFEIMQSIEEILCVSMMTIVKSFEFVDEPVNLEKIPKPFSSTKGGMDFIININFILHSSKNYLPYRIPMLKSKSDQIKDYDSYYKESYFQMTKEFPIYFNEFLICSLVSCSIFNRDQVDIRKLVETNYLGYLISSLSDLNDDISRASERLLYVILKHVDHSPYKERIFVRLLVMKIVMLLEERKQKGLNNIPSIIAAFASNFVNVITNPSHVLYEKVTFYLTKSPSFNINEIPLIEVIKSDEHLYKTFEWLIDNIISGLKTEEDFKLFRKMRVMEKFQSFGDCVLTGHKLKKLIYDITWNIQNIPSGSDYLITNDGFISWVEQVLNDIKIFKTRENKDFMNRLGSRIVFSSSKEHFLEWTNYDYENIISQINV